MNDKENQEKSSYGVSEVKTETNGCKNERCKTLIYS